MGYTKSFFHAEQGFRVGADGKVLADADGDVFAVIPLQAYKGSVSSSQNDVEVFEFTAPTDLELHSVQVYCTDVAANASVNVKSNGVVVLSSAITPIANTVAAGEVSSPIIAGGSAVTVHVTTDSTGSITDLCVTLIFKKARII